MPLLFCLAVHDALAEVKEQLLDGEVIFFMGTVASWCSSPPDTVAEPGEWQQYNASSSLEHHFRETVVIAHLRSH